MALDVCLKILLKGRIIMFITKYQINSYSKNIMDCLSDAGKMHGYIWSLFPNSPQETRQTIQLLYRIQTEPFGTFILLQSAIAPQKLPRELSLMYCVTDETMIKNLQKRDKICFNIVVNPTYKVNGKRKWIAHKQEREEWLKKKLEMNGCSHVEVEEQNCNRSCLSRKGKSFYFGCSQARGSLSIQEFDKFYSMLCSGVGHEKAYGAGLITFC